MRDVLIRCMILCKQASIDWLLFIWDEADDMRLARLRVSPVVWSANGNIVLNESLGLLSRTGWGEALWGLVSKEQTELVTMFLAVVPLELDMFEMFWVWRSWIMDGKWTLNISVEGLRRGGEDGFKSPPSKPHISHQLYVMQGYHTMSSNSFQNQLEQVDASGL